LNQVAMTKRAMRQAGKIALADRAMIFDAIAALKEWPDCRNVKALKDREGYRLRVGRYRVIFTVDTQCRPVIVRIEEVLKRNERTY